MRRALIVAGDRALTRSHAEALMGQGDADRGTDWRVARAHSALECKVLLEHGGRPFDVIIVAAVLPDAEGVDLIADLRRMDTAKEIPIFLMTERGRDPHSRRIAVARYRVAGIIELPAAPSQLFAALEGVRRRRRVLIVEPRAQLAELYRQSFEQSGFVPEICPRFDDAVERRRRFDPDLVAIALVPPKAPSEPGALGLCAELKRRASPPKVLIYGPISDLPEDGISANVERADDFVKAPFDEDLLVWRAAALVGVGAPGTAASAVHAAASAESPATLLSPVDLPPLASLHAQPDDMLLSGLPRPSVHRRENRRVPCNVTVTGVSENRSIHTRALDISPGGMFFAVDPPFEMGAVVQMSFELSEHDAPIEAEGRVAWIGVGPEGSFGVGVRFARIARPDLDRIVSYVNRVSGVLFEADE